MYLNNLFITSILIIQSNYNITKYNIFNIFFMARSIKKKGNFEHAVFKRFAIPVI
jgi:hypothetical protein